MPYKGIFGSLWIFCSPGFQAGLWRVLLGPANGLIGRRRGVLLAPVGSFVFYDAFFGNLPVLQSLEHAEDIFKVDNVGDIVVQVDRPFLKPCKDLPGRLAFLIF